MKLLIHHHTLAYSDNKGIWIQSFIGSWVNELSKHTESIGLLLSTTSTKKSNLDYCLQSSNVKVESIGNIDYNYNKIIRYFNAKEKCKSIYGYTHLLIRGITPKQMLVFNNINVKKKYFLFVGCVTDSEKNIPNNFYDIYNLIMKKFRFFQLKKIAKNSKIATNSPTTVIEMENILKIKSDFIPTNTISIKKFKKIKRTRHRKSINLIFVGRIQKEKGINELIEAFLSLNDENKTIDFSLDIVGPISVNYFDELKASYPSIIKKIKFHGFIKFSDELLDLYDKADIYLLPSYHEGFPHTIWEAAARNLPIICTNVGGIGGLIDKSMVTFVEKKNVESLKNAINKLIYSVNDTTKKSEKIFQFAKDYSVEESAKKLINWLESEKE